ncbi:MAG TPA: bacillithiol biosynthesis cysteine-adding enzyme BshC [Fulvivirga sp.]|nr:bacillithiol biosynthesis cysteine-adding enzyme BshC [Fulvivirga sp.]
MILNKLDFKETKKFSSLFLDYVQSEPNLKDFFNRFPSVENFKPQIEQKQFSAENRKMLCQDLERQYQGIQPEPSLKKNLSLLAEPNTYTITTGHQLNIFTGPLYFIYKIVTVINACKALSKAYPAYNFVPVYWMASEDHDFVEINHFRLEGKKYQWDTDQTGAVGHFSTKSIQPLVNEIPGLPDFFKQAYAKNTLAEAVRNYVNHLFGKYGLVVIDADSKGLKSLFKGVIKDDIFKNTAKEKVTQCSDNLAKLGHNPQVFPRDINFFYLDESIRGRIEEENGRFKVVDTSLEFSKEELLALIENSPEKFSPNVILRPLYQEMILPNLAYVGGPGELAYWFQLKPMFESYKTSFPILLPRNFGMVVPDHILRKIEKAQLSWKDLFEKKEQLQKRIALENASGEVLLNGQIDELMKLFSKIKEQAASIDQTLIAHVEAQGTKTKSKLEGIEKKFIRAEKRKQSDRLRQVDEILDYLFPNGGLQERTDNFLNFYLSNPSFIDNLLMDFDPFDFRFNIMSNGK